MVWCVRVSLVVMCKLCGYVQASWTHVSLVAMCKPHSDVPDHIFNSHQWQETMEGKVMSELYCPKWPARSHVQHHWSI